MRFRFAVSALGALALAATLSAQTKISGTIQCKPGPVAPVAIGDKPGHAFAVVQSECTWTRPIEIAGVPSKSGVDTVVTEMSGNKSSDRGYHLDTMANGDKFTARFQGTGTSKDGKPVSASGTWSFIEGSGKVKGIKGKGTYKGTANADGTMTNEIEGEYSLP
ncbi:MAG TPA: hypothetical protein VMH79_02045 [Thermoanaerobaculia bacterium]|nr:hypothetical protein [Thermoanaerobaculia bacterium]